jgi:hypothetical protein
MDPQGGHRPEFPESQRPEFPEAKGCSSEGLATLVPPKHLELRDPQIHIENHSDPGMGSQCRISVQRPALWVWGEAPVGQSWSDGFFHLRPGMVRDIRLPVPVTGVWHSLFDLISGSVQTRT